MQPIVLTANRPADRFYLGGPRIAEFRGSPDDGDRVPEDWIGSTTELRGGPPSAGLSVLPDGRVLRDCVADDPVSWLGEAHTSRYGDDPMLLVKLLDAGQRLPVHIHPDAGFADRHLDRRHGKAEAWYILRGGDVHIGLKSPTTRERLGALVRDQEVDALHALLHTVAVHPGDTVFVPPGTLHAIGEGVLLVEVQEPEDLSILLEWQGFEIDGSQDGHLGLGFETALEAVDLSPRTAGEVEALITRGLEGVSVLAPGAERYFTLGRHSVDDGFALDAGFAVLIVTAGLVELDGEEPPRRLDRGTTLLVPAAAGRVSLHGHGEVVVCRPPSGR